MGRLFWLITALFLSAVVHIGYVLFVPNLAFERQLSSISKDGSENRFVLLDPALQGRLVLGASPNDIVGLCKFDLSNGKVNLNADIPSTYWTLTVYDLSGQQVYALNDAQAGAQQFTVDFAKAKSITQQLFGKGDPEDGLVGDNLGWHAEVNGDKGLAILWVPLSDPLFRPGIAEKLSKTKCGLATP